jgi:hypothetical protein
LIATAHHIDRAYVLDRVLDQALESSAYTDIDNYCCQLALKMGGHASRHDAEKRMLWHSNLAHVGLKAFEILLKVVAKAPKVTRTCDCESFTKCKLGPKPFTINTTSGATEPLHFMHWDIWSTLETAIREGRHMLRLVDNAPRHKDEYILKYNSATYEKLKQWKAPRVKESGKQVKRFCTDGGSWYTSKKYAEYLKSEGKLKETTTPDTPQCNGVIGCANCTILEYV